jgi:hypothetical protein
MTRAQEFSVRFDLFERQRTRAHDTHVPSDDVPQLRELVQAQRAQRSSDSRQAGVVLHLEERPCEVDHCAVQDALVIDHHRPELIHREDAATLRHPILTEEHRSRGRRLDRDRNHDE